jgi:protein-S-isoprenylcysteine O-methyltransferase Ste14
MDKKQYRSLVRWVVVLCVSLFVGYCLLAVLYRDQVGILAVMTVLVVVVLAAMIRTVRKMGTYVTDTKKEKNDEKS